MVIKKGKELTVVWSVTNQVGFGLFPEGPGWVDKCLFPEPKLHRFSEAGRTTGDYLQCSH